MFTDPDCIFCRIVAGEIPADVVQSTEQMVAFRDLNPQAPTHILVVPRAHYPDAPALAAAAPLVLAELVTLGARLADETGTGQFRLVFNTGEQAGQSVFHVHGHVLAGRSFGWPPG